ncbi:MULTISPECIES: MliC family protein [unclassified Sulfitobacter]|uniref:MliC family protein n=1 Tax=unclassified Sulfitobacter TaxID=196795 RepID=UPI003746A04E
MRVTPTVLACFALALPVTAETTVNLSLGGIDSLDTMTYDCDGGAPLRVQYLLAGENALALAEINGSPRIFVNVVSGSGARYVSGADTLSTKGTTALLENRMDETKVKCEQSGEMPEH